MSDSIVPPLKRCTKCGQFFPATLEYFYRHDTCKDHLRSCCKACNALPGKRPRVKVNCPDGFKRCPKCDRILALSEFHMDRQKAGGRAVYCKECVCASQKAHYAPEKAHLAYQMRYAKHKETIKAKAKVYRRNNPAKVREAQKAWKRANPDRVRANRLRYYTKNQEQIREYNRKQKVRYAERRRINTQRRRARKRQLPDTITHDDWQRCLSYWNGRCAYCDNPPGLFPNMRLHADHFIPLSSPDCPGTIPTNILPACGSCNDSKGYSNPIDWLTWKFGKRKAKQIVKRIEDYFASLH